MDTFALGAILYEVKHKQRLPRFDTRPEEFKARLGKVRVANDPLSCLITGLLEDFPYRLSIDEALARPWLNPSSVELDAALLFFEPRQDNVDQDDHDGDGRMQGLDERLVSHPNHGED